MPLRIPVSLHEDLKKAAASEGVSLNQYCLYLLSRHVRSSRELMRSKAEQLFTFLEEAHALQREINKKELSIKRQKLNSLKVSKARF